MSRSLKKGPFISVKLEKKVAAMEESGKKSVIKTWSRASMISPDFVGHTFAVHNGKVTSWANLLPLVTSVVTAVTRRNNKGPRYN